MRHTATMPNRLAGETSPYLLQHAHNPVDWFPWGGDALARAKLLDRPIFLSIGYAACHWCHVMERESFEDATTAAYMNDHFVAIKVDREERPDLDQLYMGAVQAMTGQGGWPMSVFLTPDGRPFYGGTYYPDEPRHGMPSFRQVLEGVARAWREQRDELESAGARLVATLVDRQRIDGRRRRGRPDAGAPRRGRGRDLRQLRPGQRRLGPRPEVPAADDRRVPAPADGRRRPASPRRSPGSPSRRWPTAASTTSSAAASTATRPTRSGWSRTSSRCSTTTPSSRGSTCTPGRRPATRGSASVGRGVLDYMVRELTTADGAFAASQDADTDGVEGLTFTWTAAEIREVLGADAAPFLAGVRRHGPRELGGDRRSCRASGRTPTRRRRRARTPPSKRVSRRRGRGSSNGRASRPQPARDDKALAAWNGLAIAAFADAGRLLGRRATSTAVGRPRRRRRSPPASSRRTGRSAGRGRTAGPPARASSRTTPISPTGCSRCTRPRSTSAGSRRPGR